MTRQAKHSDKIARVIGFGYPGGPLIDKLAKEGDKKRV